jgi:hypothetical protein
MPDPKQKLVKVDNDVISFPSTMGDKDISAAIKKHRSNNTMSSSYSVGEKGSYFPPELSRIEHAIGPEYRRGNPLPDGGIASVAEHEPRIIEINDTRKFAQGKEQTKAHELLHLTQNQLAGGAQRLIPPDNPKAPYDISKIDQLRKQGKTLFTIPREMSATVIQTYVADPTQRKRLQPWVDDLVKTPLSIMQPTEPNDKTINRNVRPPIPPQEAYSPIKNLVEEAKKRDPRKKINTLPEQPKDALNHYANPEDQPPKVSFSFNKSWSKPGPYATKLTPQEEVEFRKWAASNPNSVRGEVGPAPNYDSLPMADYDVRGHFHAAKTGDPSATLVPNKWDGKIHGNNKFKTPYNGGFSNESMYATPKAPRWVGNKLMTHDGKLVTDETPRKTSGQNE